LNANAEAHHVTLQNGKCPSKYLEDKAGPIASAGVDGLKVFSYQIMN
jgi:hypothetical protein